MKRLVILTTLLAGAAPFFGCQNSSQSLKVDVDLVMINATVTAGEGHYVTGLQKKDFHLWEDKVEQQVEYLSTEDVPASVGLIVDVSPSMQSFGPYGRQETLTFLQSLYAESEYFLMPFADKPRIEIDLSLSRAVPDRTKHAGLVSLLDCPVFRVSFAPPSTAIESMLAPAYNLSSTFQLF